jgi:2-oxo-4-hydroxy-4-carboxy--5-ureidoimidazoline (OHCU) decarboxylase
MGDGCRPRGSVQNKFFKNFREAIDHTDWTVDRSASNRQSFSILKYSYQCEVRRAKQSSLKKLRDSHPNSSDLFLALKTASGKSSSISLPSTFTFDGTATSDASVKPKIIN